MIRARLSGFPSLSAALVSTLFAVSGCGGDGASEETPASGGGIQICDLLTDEEVSTALPNHDEGFVASSGGSLMEGVDTYQCSYSAQEGERYDLMTVIVTVGSDPEQFEDWIRPSRSSKEAYGNFRELEITDGGFLYGEPEDMKVDVWEGTTLISLNLMAPGAESRSGALVELASRIVAKLD